MQKSTVASKAGEGTMILGRTPGAWAFIGLAVLALLAICIY